ncbi:nicotinate-nucleotide--dimethylbenzimidazole phosphoribosyltransferase [Desulfosudis oleivorans]|uniref:Nicotinate-nucleotide--dimethylbenzimidazole phosphoribosyltransferase n=1 Tax=Desulfosudis oleivorans (strain DSM 6200 / JCM 39069 / Hxd3) TaxID=96561 RepID=A8ZTT6_DESOH|nr:nicotinate-nucleotide--dimethylbenzimidazole phosphoribosyltransferase [Desulfosudis oleivorans]ABW67869.1 Nicotinate-nucleotide--dimethylbenzimidazole phosphoribosyltransferase [Desulfosudis oleivorans Hxd3]
MPKKTPSADTPFILSALAPATLCRATIDAVASVDTTLLADAGRKIDNKTKPAGSLGRLETLAVQMCLVQNRLDPAIGQKNLFVFAGDHGVTAEGVSAFPSEVTVQMVLNFLAGGAAINVLCRHYGIDMKVVDMGVAGAFEDHPDLVKKKVAPGTENLARQVAMSADALKTALENGMAVFLEAHARKPIDIVGMGEMGIGNTTPATAIICALTGISPAEATGRGTGVDDDGLKRKTAVIEQALKLHCPDSKNGFEVLRTLGGFEIAGMAGAILAAASKQTAVVLDGVISTAAGLAAFVICPSIKGFLIAGHRSVEPAQKAALSFIGLEPVLDLQMRLGEGTGAVMAMDAVAAACKIMTQMASFEGAGVSTASGTATA